MPATAVVALVLGMAQPAVAMNLRTPGWDRVPAYWQQTADFLVSADGEQRAWLVPGAGFALQTWGWTIDEPMQSVARTPWVSRSQVPLTPPQTIRVLSSLEEFLETGSGSANLGATLGRLGFGYVVVRHDLDPQASGSTTSNLVSIALARSRGITRVATFGTLDFGPAIEVFRVSRGDVAPGIQVRPEGDVVTVAGGSSDVWTRSATDWSHRSARPWCRATPGGIVPPTWSATLPAPRAQLRPGPRRRGSGALTGRSRRTATGGPELPGQHRLDAASTRAIAASRTRPRPRRRRTRTDSVP